MTAPADGPPAAAPGADFPWFEQTAQGREGLPYEWAAPESSPERGDDVAAVPSQAEPADLGFPDPWRQVREPSRHEAPRYEAPRESRYEAPRYEAPRESRYEAPRHEATGQAPSDYAPRRHEPSTYEPSTFEPFEREPFGGERFGGERFGGEPFGRSASGRATSGPPAARREAPAYEPPAYDASAFEAPRHEGSVYEPPAPAVAASTTLTASAAEGAGSAGSTGGGLAQRLRGRVGSLELLLGGLFLLLGLRFLISGKIGSAGVQTWETVFVAICVQALPFVVLGTVVSAAVAALVPPSLLERVLPRKASLAVPIAGAAGALLPGCECASIPVASRLMAGGVAPAASLAFLLSAPAINPVVLTATAVAFPGQPQMVWARLLASLLASVVMGWLWVGFGRPEWLRPQLRSHEHNEGGRVRSFLAALEHDFLQSAGFLVIGALMAATLNVLVPRTLLEGVGTVPVMNLLVLGLLAVVLAICSEADAFVAASLTSVSATARLAFLVVGPMVDVKLISLQAGTFGRAFAWRFSAATFVVALICAGLVGGWLL